LHAAYHAALASHFCDIVFLHRFRVRVRFLHLLEPARRAGMQHTPTQRKTSLLEILATRRRLRRSKRGAAGIGKNGGFDAQRTTTRTGQ